MAAGSTHRGQHEGRCPTPDRDRAVAVPSILVEQRNRAQVLVDALNREIDEIVASAQLANIDDEHDPEGSTVAYERAKATALLGAAERDLQAADDAIARAASGAYGTCTVCGDDIAVERLDALPATSVCIACASTW